MNILCVAKILVCLSLFCYGNPSVCCRAKNQHVLYFHDTRFFLGDLGSEGRAAF